MKWAQPEIISHQPSLISKSSVWKLPLPHNSKRRPLSHLLALQRLRVFMWVPYYFFFIKYNLSGYRLPHPRWLQKCCVKIAPGVIIQISERQFSQRLRFVKSYVGHKITKLEQAWACLNEGTTIIGRQHMFRKCGNSLWKLPRPK